MPEEPGSRAHGVDDGSAPVDRIGAPTGSDAVVSTTISEGVVRVERSKTAWLSTGPNGGRSLGPTAYNVTVPEGWERTDLTAYARRRRERAGFEDAGPTLFTGVDVDHARVARAGPVAVVATAGVSNPAPMSRDDGVEGNRPEDGSPPDPGTVNLVAVVDRPVLAPARANLLTVVAEAKAATLLDRVGVPGTTTDAVVVGTAPADGGEYASSSDSSEGDGADDSDDGGSEATADDQRASTRAETLDSPLRFTGSGTPVGAAVRECVRAAVDASLDARYGDDPIPNSPETAEHGVVPAVDPQVRPAGDGGDDASHGADVTEGCR